MKVRNRECVCVYLVYKIQISFILLLRFQFERGEKRVLHSLYICILLILALQLRLVHMSLRGVRIASSCEREDMCST